MRSYALTIALAVLLIPVCGQSGLAADEICQPGSGLASDSRYTDTRGDSKSGSGASDTTDLLLAGDSDRGCCVLKTPKAKCVYTNKAFCERKARQANITFDFHKGVECKTISACR